MIKELSKWQQDFVLTRFDDELAIAVCGISSGKSYALSLWIVLQCLKYAGTRGLIIAQNYRALTLVLIREIKNRCSEFGVAIDHNKANNEIRFENGSVLFGFSAENPDAILGMTEINLLAIDEGAYCNEEIYNNAKDRMRGHILQPKTRIISSPSNTRVQNWFSALASRHPNCVVHATAFDNPFTSENFKNELKDRYIEGSTLYRQQVLGEIFDTDVASQIVNRSDFCDKKLNDGNEYWLGMDCSGLGADNDVIVIIDKYGIVESKKLPLADTFEKMNVITRLYEKYKFKSGYLDNTGGYGQGVLDLCKGKGLPIEGINFAQKAREDEKYPNIRTEMYINASKEIKNGFYVLVEMIDEFVAQEVTINGKGQQALVPKATIKETLGHSPDSSDAVVLAIHSMKYGLTNYDEIEKARNIADTYLSYLGM